MFRILCLYMDREKGLYVVQGFREGLVYTYRGVHIILCLYMSRAKVYMWYRVLEKV